jgi:transcriptional antiterminator NusG
MGLHNRIFQVIVPTEEQVELRDGQRRIVERRIYPGYVLVQMVLDEESWYVVRNTPGVTGFVGIGNKPTPLRQDEVDRIVKRMEAEEPVAQVKVKTGDRVRITEGSFVDFNGVVDEVYPEKGKARVLVSFFNRETPIEVDLLQIERL